MARQYAGILALVAMSVVLLRACVHGGSLESALTDALAWTALFGAIGAVVGSIAQGTIEEAVRLRMEQQIAEAEQPSV